MQNEDQILYDRIRKEEVMRDEIRAALAPKRTRIQKLFGFLNTSLGIFLLSGIFLSGATATYSTYSEKQRTKRVQEEIMRRLRIELAYRASILPLLDREVFSFTDLNTVKGALTGKNPRKEGIGELGEFWPIFIDFEGRSLYSLLWEAEKSSPSSDQLGFKELRSHVLLLTRIVNPPRLTMVQPTGEDDSQWSIKTNDKMAYSTALSCFINNSSKWQ
jgi:hypothetical protein